MLKIWHFEMLFSQQKMVVSQHLAISIGGDFYYNIRKKQIKISIEI